MYIYKKFKEEMIMSRRKSSKGITVDLSGVETSATNIKEGVYPVIVEGVTLEESRNSGKPYIKFVFEVSEGSAKGFKLFHNCSLQPQALFNLKAVLQALGFEIPSQAFDLDLGELIGLGCHVEVAHETYEGKKRPRIVEFQNGEYSEESSEEGSDDIEEALQELDLEELTQLASSLGVKKKELKKAKDEDDLLDLIYEYEDEDIEEALDSLDGDDGLEEGEEDSEEEEDSEDYSTWELKELRAECRDRGIKLEKGLKKKELVKLLEEDDEE